MSKRTLQIWVFPAAAFLAACGASEPARPAAGGEAAVTAEVRTAERISAPVIYEAVGTVRARKASTLSSKAVGQVMTVRVAEGDRVRRGQELARIDARDSAAQVELAEAGIREAESALREVDRGIEAALAARQAAEANSGLAAATYERYRQLLERKSVSQQEFDEVEARHSAAAADLARADAMVESARAKKQQVVARREQAQASTRTAQAQLSFSVVQAPFDGVVSAKHVDPGDLAAPGVPLLTVEAAEGFRLEAEVQESQAGIVKAGQKVRVSIDAVAAELEGVVDEVGPRLDPASRSFTVKLNLPSHAALRSGMFGRAFFESGEKSLLGVPEQAVVRKGQLTGLYVVDGEGRARFRLIRTGKENAGLTEVLSGLQEGERFVAQPQPAVRDGVRIR